MPEMKITSEPGPLDGLTVVEVGGIGPGPFAGMVLAGMGATVHRIDRPGATEPPRTSPLLRGRTWHELDLKTPGGLARALDLVRSADALYEGFRPGVMERLGLGPRQCQEVNHAIVYARMTGWGQAGPYALQPGHDINYLAVSGLLSTLGAEGEPPQPPVNYVADYGAGGMMLVAGILGGIFRRHQSGTGSVIDVAMVDGAAMMLADVLARIHAGDWLPQRRANAFDGGAHFYRTYRTADGRYMAVGAIEPQFYREFLAVLQLNDVDPREQYQREKWPKLSHLIAEVFEQQTQEYWQEAFAGRPACVSPVVALDQLGENPHLRARGTVISSDAGLLPASAPRFSLLDTERGTGR